MLRAIWLASVLAVVGATGCGDDLGEPCRSSDDCGGDTYCCTDGKCGGGICTFRCSDDRDCPSDTVCRSDSCLFSCASDRDCAGGFQCKEKDGQLACEGD